VTSRELALSVLDLVPVRTGQRSSDAIAATTALAVAADELGYTRYWLAEHHNMPSVASTNPAVLIGVLASRTRRIRVGSGGVMLPNHAPLVVAEQFAALEASAPGRIDLGIGRAPGSDPVISALLQSSGHTSEVDTFPSNVTDIIKLLSPEGAILSLRGGQTYPLRATPAADGVPTVWLLGSSDYSARLAAQLGLPYVFAHHFSGEGTAEALRLYRSQFRPSENASEPRTLLTANVVAADTAEEANARALPQLQHMARLRSGEQLTALATIEEAARTVMTAAQEAMIERMRAAWIIDEAGAAADRVRALAERFDVDEVMISPASGSSESDPIDRTPGRETTIRLLGERLLSPALVG